MSRLIDNRRGIACAVGLFSLFLALVLSRTPEASVSAKDREAFWPASDREAVPFQEGITFTAWWEGHYQRPRSEISLEALADTGANWISVVPTAHQATYASTDIDFTDPATPTDEDLSYIIELAQSLGLKVMLKPHVDLWNETESGHWRGDIGKGFDTEREWSAWFASYRDFIEHYAALAAEHGVDQFCIGTELLGTSQRAADWREIVTSVRAIYGGPLVYASLHGEEARSITWWDAVDYIGIDAYYPLAGNLEPCLSDLMEAWEVPMQEMARLSYEHGKKIILTEIGYESLDGCTKQPWHSTIRTDIDLAEQALAYQAAFQSLRDQSWLAGLFWWEWFSDPFTSGPCDTTMSPHQKPAEDVLRAWYGGVPREWVTVIPDYGRTRDIYRDDLGSGWQNWSWDSQVDAAATSPVYEGAHSMSVTLEPWGALSLWHPALETDEYRWLEFHIRGSASAQPVLSVYFRDDDGADLPRVPINDCRHVSEGTIETAAWKRVRLPIRYLNPDGVRVTRLTIQDESGSGADEFWIDDVRLVPAVEPSHRIFFPMGIKVK